jgi:hypothetical protein
MNNIRDIQSIGNFIIESGKIIVSDPCYETRGGNWQSLFENVKKGEWKAYIIETDGSSWGVRVGEIFAIHSDYELDDINWNRGSTIGVDSGQAGIYDLKYYKDDKCVSGTKFYYRDATHKKNINEFDELAPLFNKRNEMDPKEFKKEIYRQYEEVLKKYKNKVVVTEHELNYGNDKPGDLWYDANCALTHTVKNPPGEYDKNEIEYQNGGCLKYGCVSSAGFGDGSYSCYYARIPSERKFIKEDPYGEEEWQDTNPIIGIRIIFIEDEEI